MMIDTTFSLYALLIANSCLLAAAALAVLRFQRQLRESADFWASPTGAAMQTEQPETIDQRNLLMHEIAALQKSVAELRDREPQNVEPLSAQFPLEHAVRMAKGGASIEDLTKSCGLNLGEAQLMRRLHSQRTLSESLVATA